MIIDTDEAPTYDPVHGWRFKKTAEEEAVEAQIRAGPPKMPMVAPAATAAVAAPPAATGPLPPPPGGMPPAGMPLAPPPPPPGGPMRGPSKYVDSFNAF